MAIALPTWGAGVRGGIWERAGIGRLVGVERKGKTSL